MLPTSRAIRPGKSGWSREVFMKCEIEFLPVGSASKAGDAIVVRYGEPDDFRLMLVDGGHAETMDQGGKSSGRCRQAQTVRRMYCIPSKIARSGQRHGRPIRGWFRQERRNERPLRIGQAACIG